MALAPPPVSLYTEDTGPRAPDISALLEEEPRRPVPHHLLESKIYSKVGRSGSIQAEPPILHFGGYEIGKCQQRLLRLVNVSGDVSSLHIIPPRSRHFSISYRKANRLVPGLALTVEVQFIPDEWRQYCDIIRVHCQGDGTLAVPLHGYPAPALAAPPPGITLHAASLGRSARHVLPLRCSCPVAFGFRIVCTQQHPDFHISPTSGIIPGDGVVNVTVTFTPSSYGSAHMSLELLTSEFNAKPHRCTFTGVCAPHASKVEKVGISSEETVRGPEKTSLRASRKKTLLKTLQHHASQVEKLQDGPLSLCSPHAVASVLNQPPGRLRLKDMRAGLTCAGKKGKTRQEKETLFQQLLQQNIAEEEANQLRWQVWLGGDAISPSERRRVTDEREGQVSRPDLHTDCDGQSVRLLPGRVMRGAGQPPTSLPQFDLYLNDLWANRKRALGRFQQAARQVVIGCRVDRRRRKLLGAGPCESDQLIPPLSANRILPYDFPPFPAEPDGSPAGDPRSAAPGPSALHLTLQLPFCQLKVPQHYRMMGYQPVSYYEASATYHPPQLAPPLRRGAEDELLPTAVSPPDAPHAAFSQQPIVSSQVEAEEKSLVGTILSLTPPEQLLHPPDFPPAHVYNPAPGLLAFKRRLPYAETDLDYQLCPLPHHSAGSAHRKETIPGAATWRRFPPPAAYSSHRKRPPPPRRCDPFNADLLPSAAPPTLSDLPAADKENIAARDEAAGRAGLTLGMLRAEFPLIQDGGHSDNGHQAGHQDEEDSLALRLQRRLQQMKMMSHRDRLILD